MLCLISLQTKEEKFNLNLYRNSCTKRTNTCQSLEKKTSKSNVQTLSSTAKVNKREL